MEVENTYLTENSLVKYKLEFLTYTIPTDGCIIIKLPFKMRTALNNIRNIRCEPGKNIPRANDRIIECKKHSRDEFILQGFNRIENNNNYVSWDISMYREIYLVAEFMDKGANSLVRNSRF